MNNTYDIGMVGLGVMGRNLLLNIASHGYSVAGYDIDPLKVQALKDAAEGRSVNGATTLQEFLGLLRTPRAIILLVPAGKPVDAVLGDLQPLLGPGDMVIDSGNSWFRDTDRRRQAMASSGIDFAGMGISGGEHGARFGASMMFGGSRELYSRISPMLEAVAAKVNDEPCVAFVGNGAAGHYVKMVHNGIEYGLMQLLSETYDLMRRGAGMPTEAIRKVYERWNKGETASYLVEITADIFWHIDPKTGSPLVELILDKAKQKGTGQWTSQEAMEIGVPVPAIDAAVAARQLSAYKSERVEAAKILPVNGRRLNGDREQFLEQLRNAFYTASIVIYAQGMSLLRAASTVHSYGLDLAEIARIWRGGCIIRAALLEEIRAAFSRRPELANLLVDPALAGELMRRHNDLRDIAALGSNWQIPLPTMMASLAYFDGYRSERLPANLIQAQRDYFGAHTYERIDQEGVFHTEWEGEQSSGPQPGLAPPAPGGEQPAPELAKRPGD